MSEKEAMIKQIKYEVAKRAFKDELEALLSKIYDTAVAFKMDETEFMLATFMDMLLTAAKTALINGKELDAIGYGKALQSEIDSLKAKLEKGEDPFS